MNNVYQKPESSLEKQGSEITKKYTIGKKFLISLAWVFPLFFLLIAAVLPKDQWADGSVGALMFSAGGSFISSFIPTQQKYIFVGISILLAFGSALIVGLVIK